MLASKRNTVIDSARGIGILLVFIGHLFLYDSIPFRIIFNFHMPLFFLLSGIVFNPNNVPAWHDFRRKISKNILAPLILASLIGTSVNIFCSTFLPTAEHEYISILGWLAEITNGSPRFVPNAWFLTCLAMTQMTFWLIFVRHPSESPRLRLLGITVFALLCAVLVTPLPLKAKIICPLKMLSVPMSLTFFALGCFYKERLKTLSKWAILLFPVTMFLSTKFRSPNLAIPEFPNVWCFAICSTTGILAILWIAKSMDCPALQFIGRNSLVFFLLEGHAVRFVLHLGHFIYPQLSQSPLTDPLPFKSVPIILISSLLLISGICPLFNRLLDSMREIITRTQEYPSTTSDQS